MKVGDYVRTKKGTIYQFNSTSSKALSGAKKYMVKSSPNIIDLIEVGDYVNGNKIIKICDDFAGRKILVYGYDNGERQVAITIYEKDIKSILTHEQFESMEYLVEKGCNDK